MKAVPLPASASGLSSSHDRYSAKNMVLEAGGELGSQLGGAEQLPHVEPWGSSFIRWEITDGPRECHTERSESEKERSHDSLYTWNLKKKKKKKKIQRNLQNRKRLTDLENELMVAWGKDGAKG